MNKHFYLLIFFFTLIVSCKKEGASTYNIVLSQNADWVITDFKNDYTIQLPTDYFGAGKDGFEGNIFYKEKDDSSIVFSYNYCSSLFCSDFGDTLMQPFLNSIDIKINDSLVTLNKQVSFVDSNLSQTAILYYNDENKSHARLYWKDNGMFKQALEVTFNYSGLEEIIDIVKTIKRK